MLRGSIVVPAHVERDARRDLMPPGDHDGLTRSRSIVGEPDALQADVHTNRRPVAERNVHIGLTQHVAVARHDQIGTRKIAELRALRDVVEDSARRLLAGLRGIADALKQLDALDVLDRHVDPNELQPIPPDRRRHTARRVIRYLAGEVAVGGHAGEKPNQLLRRAGRGLRDQYAADRLDGARRVEDRAFVDRGY